MAKVRSGQAVARRTARPVEKSGPMTRTNTIEAKLTGDAICTAEGHTVKAGTPVIVLCRALVEAGYDPASRMEVWRGDTLALKVRRIGEAARLCIAGKGNGFAVDKTALRGAYKPAGAFCVQKRNPGGTLIARLPV
jgi:hypothetical protein